MNFEINTEKLKDDAYVISLGGEVDLYTAPEFKQQLLEVIGEGATHVVVDLTKTTFIDSTTLGVLVGGVKRLRTSGGQLALVCADRNITKIFEITGLDRVFTIYSTLVEAVDKVAASGQALRSWLACRCTALSSHDTSRITLARNCARFSTRLSRLSSFASGASSVRRSSSEGCNRSCGRSSAIGRRRASLFEDDVSDLEQRVLACVGRERALAGTDIRIAGLLLPLGPTRHEQGIVL